ncbi:hypothetical protein Afil01_57720 [Actinorhabdospora filicis]|uniref:Uncharacterized protein n=1 Tax=Actinorhabdospora filicis TaxID=1785913 RepID=A0A9W6SQ81_9ACTN|nr:hypothetical protein [Actinorhabdospora filicis]GLZ80965.1 hypothetical protein Afil01_57720 [Actinorhabdospora filicis]
MTKLVKAAADRLLTAIMPRGRAGACVPNAGDSFWSTCECYPGERRTRQYCTISCSGHADCGSCVATQSICPG